MLSLENSRLCSENNPTKQKSSIFLELRSLHSEKVIFANTRDEKQLNDVQHIFDSIPLKY